MSDSKTPEALARTFIDSVVEINRRHGMTDSVPQAVYEAAVKDTEKAVKGLRPTARPVEDI